MHNGSSPETADAVTTTTQRELTARIDRGEYVFILDSRAQSDFEEWHVDGENVEIVNFPYFLLLDGIPGDLHKELPDEKRITVLCGDGGTSEFVAETLEQEGYDVDRVERGMNG
ncbi:MAG: rhodanese-like domain-containing protein [Halolamina sp.]